MYKQIEGTEWKAERNNRGNDEADRGNISRSVNRKIRRMCVAEGRRRRRTKGTRAARAVLMVKMMRMVPGVRVIDWACGRALLAM